MKVNIKKLPKGYSVVNGRIVKNMSDGGTSTGDQNNFGLTTVPPLPNYESGSSNPNDISARMAFSLPAVPREQANLEAEKGETVLTDMNNDGSFELYNIGGNRHHSGGTPLNLPPQSFIYSDTSKMKLNKYELAEMGIESKKKLTPAKVSKMYQLNQFIGTLDDEHTDKIASDTAEYMLNKNKKSLSQLAFLQEAKKEFEDGVPLAAYPYLQEKGINPMEYAQKIQGINAQEAEQQMLMQLPIEKRMEILLMKEAAQQQQAQMQQQQMMSQQGMPPQGMPPQGPPQQGGMPPQGPPPGMAQQGPPPGMMQPPQQQAPMPMARYGGQFALPTYQDKGEVNDTTKYETNNEFRHFIDKANMAQIPAAKQISQQFAVYDAFKNFERGNSSAVLENLLDAGWRGAQALNPIGTLASPYMKEYVFNPLSEWMFPKKQYGGGNKLPRVKVIQYPYGHSSMPPGHIEASLIDEKGNYIDDYNGQKGYINRWINSGNQRVNYRGNEEDVRTAILELDEQELQNFLSVAQTFTPGGKTNIPGTNSFIPTAPGGGKGDYDFINSNCADGVCRGLGMNADEYTTLGMTDPTAVMDAIRKRNDVSSTSGRRVGMLEGIDRVADKWINNTFGVDLISDKMLAYDREADEWIDKNIDMSLEGVKNIPSYHYNSWGKDALNSVNSFFGGSSKYWKRDGGSLPRFQDKGEYTDEFTKEIDEISYLPSELINDTIPGKKLLKADDETKIDLHDIYASTMNSINSLPKDAGVGDYIDVLKGLDLKTAKRIIKDTGIKSKNLQEAIYNNIGYDDMRWIDRKAVDAGWWWSGLKRGGQPRAQDGTEMPLFNPMNFNTQPYVAQTDNTYVHQNYIPQNINFNELPPVNIGDNNPEQTLPLHLQQNTILANYENDLKNAIADYDAAALLANKNYANRFDPNNSGIQTFGASSQPNDNMVKVWMEHINQGGPPPATPDVNYTAAYKQIHGDDASVPVNTKGKKNDGKAPNITNVYNVKGNDNDKASNNRDRMYGNMSFPGESTVDPIYSGNEDQIFSAKGLPLSYGDTSSPYYVGSQWAFLNGGSLPKYQDIGETGQYFPMYGALNQEGYDGPTYKNSMGRVVPKVDESGNVMYDDGAFIMANPGDHIQTELVNYHDPKMAYWMDQPNYDPNRTDVNMNVDAEDILYDKYFNAEEAAYKEAKNSGNFDADGYPVMDDFYNTWGRSGSKYTRENMPVDMSRAAQLYRGEDYTDDFTQVGPLRPDGTFRRGGGLPLAKKGVEYNGYTYSKKELNKLAKSKDPNQRLLYAEIMNGGPIVDQQTQVNNQMSNINKQRVDTESQDEVTTYTTSGNEDWIDNFSANTDYQDDFYNEYVAYRKKNKKSVLPKEEFITNYIEFQKQNRYMNENYTQEDLSNPSWDRRHNYVPCTKGDAGCTEIDGSYWKKDGDKQDANFMYNNAMTEGGFEAMDQDMISHMQAGYIGGKVLELGEDERQQFHASGVNDQEMFGLPISGDDGYWGNTTNRQLQGDKNVTPAVESVPCSNAEELQKLCADAGGVWSPYVAEVKAEDGTVTTPASGCECDKEIPKKPEDTPTPEKKKADFWLQDELGIANALDNKMSLKKYYPWAPTYQNIQVDPVFKDPTREIAAIGEQAVIAANTASTFSGPQRAAAVQAKAQGVAAKQIADAVNKVQNDNVTIANQTNIKNAELEYKTQVLNNNELKQLYDNTQLTEQNYDNALREANSAITKQLQNAYTNRANTANLNSIYPQFDIDPKSGGFINVTDPKSFYADPNYTDPATSLDQYEETIKRLKNILPEDQWDKLPVYSAPDNSKAGKTNWAQQNQNTIMSTGYNTQGQVGRYGKEIRKRNLLKKGAQLRNWFSPLRGK